MFEVSRRVMPSDLLYTGCLLDRAADQRRDAGWVAERLNDPRSLFIPVWRDRNLIIPADPPTAAAVAGTGAQDIIPLAAHVALLGIDNEARAWFAADLSALEREVVSELHGGAQFTDLRRYGAVMDRADGSVLAYARGLMHWHNRHRFCGVCGSPTVSREGGHIRVCTDPDCRAQHFPRTDPAVIMLVTRPGPDGGACLLARQSKWPSGMVSTLAGFLEPGESLEEAVAREVAEETDVAVGAVRYRASQPWPFPSSLMLGFRAEAAADADIRFAAQELEDARWFTRADIAVFPETGLTLPRADSIARWLVEEWLAEG